MNNNNARRQASQHSINKLNLENMVRQHNVIVSNFTSDLNNKNRIIVEKDNDLSKLNTELTNKNRIIVEKDNELQKKLKLIDDLNIINIKNDARIERFMKDLELKEIVIKDLNVLYEAEKIKVLELSRNLESTKSQLLLANNNYIIRTSK